MKFFKNVTKIKEISGKCKKFGFLTNVIDKSKFFKKMNCYKNMIDIMFQ